MPTAVFNRARAWSLLVHRYVGLVMATFLLVAGVTGSLIAFYVPLDTMLNPVLFVAEHAPDTPMLDPFALKEALERQLPAGSEPLTGVSLHMEPGKNVNFWVDGHEVFVNPYTGKIAGKRKFGELWGQGRQGLMTFIYELHFTLGLGDVGRTLFGLVALLWTLDCFVGAYLTLPLAKQGGRASQKSWFSRWLPMWLLKTNKLFTGVFTWHRASGLWIWMSLLIFAWSAVALNLEQVYEPVMGAVFGRPAEHELPELDPPRHQLPISLRAAAQLGQRLMSEQAARRGFEVLHANSLYYMPEHGAFNYGVESTLDISERLADTSVTFDETGKLLAFSAPTGQHAGSTVSSWLIALHFGSIRAGGLAYRTYVCIAGVMVALLSISGVWIWWKKRAARQR